MKVLRLSALFALVFGLLSVANRISAQEEAPSQFEHIKGLEPFVGFWTAEAPEGEGGPMTLICRLTSNRSYLRMEASVPGEDGGRRQVVGTMLIGQDHAKDQVSIWSFWPDDQGQGKVEVGDGTATWSTTSVHGDGRKGTGHVSMKVDGDKLTIDVTNRKIGDESEPDMHLTFTRSQRRGRRGGRGGQ